MLKIVVLSLMPILVCSAPTGNSNERSKSSTNSVTNNAVDNGLSKGLNQGQSIQAPPFANVDLPNGRNGPLGQANFADSFPGGIGGGGAGAGGFPPQFGAAGPSPPFFGQQQQQPLQQPFPLNGQADQFQLANQYLINQHLANQQLANQNTQWQLAHASQPFPPFGPSPNGVGFNQQTAAQFVPLGPIVGGFPGNQFQQQALLGQFPNQQQQRFQQQLQQQQQQLQQQQQQRQQFSQDSVGFQQPSDLIGNPGARFNQAGGQGQGQQNGLGGFQFPGLLAANGFPQSAQPNVVPGFFPNPAANPAGDRVSGRFGENQSPQSPNTLG